MAPNSKRVDTTAGIVLILPGIALALLGPRFDGFAKGMCLGAGIAMILIGVYLIGARTRKPATKGDDAMWLPSRDHDDTDGTDGDTGRDQR